MNDELAQIIEWRWVDEKGRAMTEFKRGNPPIILEVTDDKGTMKVEIRLLTQNLPD